MAYTETLLWDYIEDNGGVIPYSGQLTLRNSIFLYDLLVVEVVSASGDLSDPNWHQTCIFNVPIKNVISSYDRSPNTFLISTYYDREHRIKITGNTYQIISSTSGNTNGIIKIWGAKYS